MQTLPRLPQPVIAEVGGAYTGDVIVANMMEAETTEGVAAFLEKREPEWEK